MTEYFCGEEQLGSYLIFPRFLLRSGLSETAMLLYMVLLDRARLSAQHEEWRDEDGRVYLSYTIESLAECIGRGRTVVVTGLSALEKAGLIRRKRMGIGLPNRIYLKIPAAHPGAGNAALSGAEDRPSESRKSDLPETGKPAGNQNRKRKTKKQKQPGRAGRPALPERIYECQEDESL